MAGYTEAYHLPPPQDTMTNEMAEDVMEASFARGLAAAECFEVSPRCPQLTCTRMLASQEHGPVITKRQAHLAMRLPISWCCAALSCMALSGGAPNSLSDRC